MANNRNKSRKGGARKRMVVSAGLLCAAISYNACAIPVFGFEPGQIGWESVGDVSLQSAAFGITPTEGTQQAVITTLCDRPAVGWCNTTLIEKPYSGVSSVPDVQLRAPTSAAQFLGMPTSQIAFRGMFEQPPSASPNGESGAIRLSFFANAGDTIAFDWNFFSQGPDGDSAYFTLWSDSFRQSELFRDLIFGPFPGRDTFQPSDVDLCSRQVGVTNCNLFPTKQTGYNTKFLSIQEGGWYSLGFALLEVAEGTVPSALAIDNVRVVRVPEPDTIWLYLASILSLAVVTRRKYFSVD